MPKRTAVALAKPVPAMSTVLPPPVGPLGAVTPVTLGDGGGGLPGHCRVSISPTAGGGIVNGEVNTLGCEEFPGAYSQAQKLRPRRSPPARPSQMP